jgi:hypothetical protein
MKRFMLVALVLVLFVGLHSQAFGWGRSVGGGTIGPGGVTGENAYLQWIQIDVPITEQSITSLTLGDIGVKVGQPDADYKLYVIDLGASPLSLTLTNPTLSSGTPYPMALTYPMSVPAWNVTFTWTVDSTPTAATGHALLDFRNGSNTLGMAYRDYIEITFPFYINGATTPYNDFQRVDAVPLPSALFLFGPALAGLALVRRRLKK